MRLTISPQVRYTQNNDLVVSILDATAVKADINRCFRCKSVDHVLQECPFLALKVQVETSQKKSEALHRAIPLVPCGQRRMQQL